jgi:inner membrane protein
MDNITHSLVGVALGALALRVAPRAAELPKHSKLVVWTAILANNAPDIDVFLPSLLKGGSLMALLEHRGFTHTVTMAPILAIAVVGVSWILSLCPRLNWKWFWWLVGLAVVGVLMHLGADFCNDYGVHPFSPFYNRWFYGDFIFIVEPLVWFAILPLAFFESRKVVLKILVVALYLVMGGLLIFGPYSPFYVVIALTLWAVIAWYWQKWVSRGKWAPLPSLALVAAVLFCFHHYSEQVKIHLTQILAENRPGEKIVQLARTPAPSDPFCWKAVIVTDGPEDQYTIRSAAVSLLPRWIRPSTCLQGLDRAHTLQLEPTSLPVRNGPLVSTQFEVTWQGEFRRELSELGRLDQDFCQFRLLRQFARAPFWAASDDCGWYAGDFRYDRGNGDGFASVRFATNGRDTVCPPEFPPGFKGWDPPVPLVVPGSK